MPDDPASLEATLKAAARALGFDAAGLARADEAWEAGARLAEFVAEGRHGEMRWMEDTLARRRAPTAMWPKARSALVVAMNYGPDHNPLDTLAARESGNISVYARGRDYHDLIRSRLKQLAGGVARLTGADVKVFVDTAPLMEKPLAQRAGLGWQGKHTNLVSRDLGSWFFLGTVLTSADLAPDAPEPDHCGTCRACLDICPTAAFPAPYQLDARRCISYLTIEHAGPIPREFRAAMGNRIYGCDDCLAACPWNKFAASASEAALFARAELKTPGLDELAALDDAAFREIFSGSPVKRSGRDRFVRNVCVAIGNSGQPTLTAHLLPLLNDASPLVRGAAIWALARLDPACFAGEKARRRPAEHDTSVQEEWDLGA
ncbi:MAG: tRNA epoxyqueuosine(34) reductase QueG [Hyphomonas sp.]|uniref:tRNA epoxyqueuosine(34) reductase QueG n=1 Tax=Hyphomonas sp. TaxID=87 RepID=UPI00349FF98D